MDLALMNWVRAASPPARSFFSKKGVRIVSSSEP
jgi:hypothetical protein